MQAALYKTMLVAAAKGPEVQHGRDVLEIFRKQTACHGLDYELPDGLLRVKQQKLQEIM